MSLALSEAIVATSAAAGTSMTLAERSTDIRARFESGEIRAEELLLHLEPVLMQSVVTRDDADEARALVNSIERAIFTEIEPVRSHALLAWIDSVITVVSRTRP